MAALLADIELLNKIKNKINKKVLKKLIILYQLILIGKRKQVPVGRAAVWPKALAEAIFERPKNREDSSDFDENLTEMIAVTQTFI